MTLLGDATASISEASEHDTPRLDATHRERDHPHPAAPDEPRLRRGLTVVERPDGAVQIGWDPDRAVLVDPPEGVTTEALADLLRSLALPRGRAVHRRRSLRAGMAPELWDEILAELVRAGLVEPVVEPPPHTVLVVGAGPLAELVTRMLPGPGLRVVRSSGRRDDLAAERPAPTVVVLADTLVADPGLVADLMAERISHLPVLLRDGTGLVGPFVMPGRSACLRCTDLHRRDRDPAWPMVAAQLLGTVGSGTRAARHATAAVAAAQVHTALAESRPFAPATLGVTLTVDVDRVELGRRTWTTHPGCGCTGGLRHAS